MERQPLSDLKRLLTAVTVETSRKKSKKKSLTVLWKSTLHLSRSTQVPNRGSSISQQSTPVISCAIIFFYTSNFRYCYFVAVDIRLGALVLTQSDVSWLSHISHCLTLLVYSVIVIICNGAMHSLYMFQCLNYCCNLD